MNIRHSVAVCGLVFIGLAVEGLSSEPQLLFETHLNADRPRFPSSVADLAIDARGNVVVTGSTQQKDGVTAALLNRYDAAGVQKWMSVTTIGDHRFTRGN